MKKSTTLAAVVPAAIVEDAWQGVEASFERFCLTAGIEVSPRPSHLQFIVSAAKACLERYPHDSAFWVDQGIGRRVCALIEGIWRQDVARLDARMALRTDVDRLLAAFVSVGVAQACQLEKALVQTVERQPEQL